MNASSQVVPYTVYHIKLVIANRNDTSFNSAVFLEAGSFNIGQANIGDDLTIDTGSAICYGESTTLDSGLDPAVYEFEWTLNGVTIPGATGATIVVTEPGTYGLTASNIGTDCQMQDSVVIEFNPELPIEEPIDLVQCSTIFDLTQNDAIMLNGLPSGNYDISYHTTLESAEGLYNAIISSTAAAAYDSPGQTIYVRVDDLGTSGSCHAIKQFELIVNPSPSPADYPDVTVCDSYVLPALSSGGYFNGPDGTGPIAAGSTISASQTVYVYEVSNTTPPCSGETSFEVVIVESPVADQPADIEACNCATLPALSSGSYYTGPGGTGDELAAGDQVCASAPNQVETITLYVYAETVQGNTSCTDQNTFQINFSPINADEPADVTACNQYILPQLSAGNGYFDGPLGSGGQHAAGDAITASQLMYVYAVSPSDPTCSSESSFQISIFESPEAFEPTPLEACDDNNDGFATFNLSLKNAEITGGAANITVTYHETMANATNNVLPIGPSYVNVNQWTQTVYARVFNAGAPACATIVELVLVVNTRPVPNAITDYALCDYDAPGDGFEQFLLSTKTLEATGGQPGITATYHASLGDAQTGAAPIDPDAPYTNTTAFQQEIFVRIENDITGCSATTSFDLIVNPLPQPVAPEPLAACSDGITSGQAVFDLTVKNLEILGGQAGFSVTYYNTLGDAQGETGAITPANAYTGQDGETVYVRMEDDATGCYSTTQLALEVIEGPVALDPQPLEYCDPNNDGFGNFDLSLAIPQIIGGAGNVTVTFHETPQDAQFGTNPVGPAYSNINQWTQTIYVRVESNLAPCYDTVELQLIVNPTPVVQSPDPIEVCDDNADGIGTFNLTVREAQMLGGLDPALHAITYHMTQANAIAGTNPISGVLAFSNTVPNAQTIWVRVEVSATDCFTAVPLELIVNPLPVVPFPAAPYELCDVNNTGDEVEEFDLAGYGVNITQEPGMEFSYYLTQAEAEEGDPLAALPGLYTNVEPGVQTIFVRVENQDTGCYAVTLLDLRVEPLPAPVIPDAAVECDADQNGFAEFDLDALVEDILDGAPDTEVTFHETYENADMGVFPLASPYENINAFAQTIYIRAENTLTGCYSVVAMQLEVKASPEMPELEPIQACDTNQDGMMLVDLTVQTQPILDAQSGTGPYIVRYYQTLAAAEAGTPAISSPQTYLGSNGQTIWVRVSDTDTGCFTIGSFLLQIDTPLAVLPAYQLSVCDNLDPFQDNLAEFDLTSMDGTITGNSPGYSVQYHLTLADAQSGNAIASPESFLNSTIPGVNNPYTLYVSVTDGATGCQSFTTLTIRVLPLPTPKTDPADLVACDNVDSPNGTELFDLTVNEGYIADGDPNLAFEYYDAAGEQILVPTAYEGSGTIYIHVMNSQVGSDGANCRVIVEQVLIVNPLPEVNAGVVNAVCQQNNTGTATFTLSQSNAEVLGAGQDIAGFTFSYHLTLAEAQDGTGALPDQYQNVANPQEIYVRVVNAATGCANTAMVTLIADNGSAAGAIDPADPRITTCDTDGANDGFFEFDLTQFDAEILGAQGPEYTLHYYDDQALMDQDIAEGPATAYPNAIADPSAYTNASAFSQEIYALVLNTDSVTGCPAVSQFTLTVNPLPEPVISDDSSGIICVDFETQEASPVVLSTNYGSDPAYSFEWYLGSDLVGTDPTYTVTSIAGATATYGVVVTDVATGCASDPMATTVITRSGPAVITDIIVTNAFTDSQTITVVAEGYGQYEYSLDGGPWQAGNVFYDVPLGVSQSGEHLVEVRDVLGNCGPAASASAFLIGYPKYFTPNGDGIHDTWNIVGLYDQPNAKIYIFDRYGKLIKQLSPSADSQGWDGTMNGSPLPSTDYWFRVEYQEQGVAKEFRAHFSLKR